MRTRAVHPRVERERKNRATEEQEEGEGNKNARRAEFLHPVAAADRN